MRVACTTQRTQEWFDAKLGRIGASGIASAMKIYKPTEHLADIGSLDHCVRLPTAGRIARGMKTTCKRCRKAVTQSFFIAGFKTGEPNMIFHAHCVVGESAYSAMLLREQEEASKAEIGGQE